jgi:hypothetical protein
MVSFGFPSLVQINICIFQSFFEVLIPNSFRSVSRGKLDHLILQFLDIHSLNFLLNQLLQLTRILIHSLLS